MTPAKPKTRQKMFLQLLEVPRTQWKSLPVATVSLQLGRINAQSPLARVSARGSFPGIPVSQLEQLGCAFSDPD